jgi:hypothetical protein
VRGYGTPESALSLRASAGKGPGAGEPTREIRTGQGTMSEAEAQALFKMAEFTPPAGMSTQEAYDMLQGRSNAPAPSLMRDTSNEEAAAVKLTAVGTLLVPCVFMCVDSSSIF